ncbi:unnamed protein product [Trichobilharzia szidati]|nr:unnamed protein product [Trichobilharzia szidati]
MSTFYSDLAKEIEEEDISFDRKKKIEDDDLDEILNSLDQKNDLGNQKSVFKLNGDTNSSLEFSGRTDRPKSQGKSPKNILDALIDPFKECNTLNTEKSEVFLDSAQANEHKKRPGSSVSKRTVRFSDDVDTSFPEMTNSKISDSSDRDQSAIDKSVSKKTESNVSNLSRPQTAPTSSEFGRLSFRDSFPDDDESSANQILDILSDRKSLDNSKPTKATRPHTRRPSSLESVTRIPITPQPNNFDRLNIDHLRSQSPFEKKHNYESIESEAQIKRLEMERDNLMNLLELIKRQHREEIQILEQTSKTKLDLMKEGAERKESRLREEISFLETQNRERLLQMEEKRDQLLKDLTNKLNETRQTHQRELEELKSSHNEEIELLKQHHQELIDRLKSASQLEMRTITELQPNSEQLKNLLDQLKTTLMDLSRQEQEQIRNANIRQEQLARREEALRAIEDRLNQRENSLDYERKQIADSFTKLEIQFREHTKLATDDKWAAKQEYDRLAKTQISLEEERRCLIDQSGRARAEMQQLVTTFIGEHRKAQVKNMEERNLIAEEHQRLRAEQLNWEEKQKADELAMKKAKEDIDTMKDALASERQALNERISKVRIDEVKLEETRRQLDIVRCDLVREQELLTRREEYLDQRQDELNKRADVLSQAEKLLKESECRHRRLQDEQSRQFAELQERSHKLHEAEKHLVIEKKELAQQMEKLSKRKMETENLRQSLCSNCRTPVRESSASNLRIRHKLGSSNAGGIINNGVKQVSALHNDVKAGNGTWVDFCQLRASQDQVSIHFRQSDIPHTQYIV